MNLAHESNRCKSKITQIALSQASVTALDLLVLDVGFEIADGPLNACEVVTEDFVVPVHVMVMTE